MNDAGKDAADSPDVVFIQSARRYVAATSGQGLRRITLLLTDGTRRRIDVVAIEPAWPPAEGWACRGDRGAMDGRTFTLSGHVLAVFRVLAEAGEGWVSLEQIRETVWDCSVDERTVQNVISKLRKAIRHGLNLAKEGRTLVEVREDAYRLTPMRQCAKSA